MLREVPLAIKLLETWYKTYRPLGILFPGELNNVYVLLPIFWPTASKLVIGHKHCLFLLGNNIPCGLFVYYI